MPASPIKYQDRNLRLFKCARDPDLDSRTILVEDQWDYVNMWLKRNNKPQALFFWKQAEEFARASRDLPNTSSPLPKYYAALNAAKALLHSKNLPFSPYHGVTGNSIPGPVNLANEQVRLKTKGVASELCRYMGEPVNITVYNLENIFYNLPFIHRAYTVTFPVVDELFLPISEPAFVRIDNSSDAFFRCKVFDNPYQNAVILGRVAGYERDNGFADSFIRKKKRFKWDAAQPDAANVPGFKTYYRRVRQHTFYIKGITRLWYIKMTSGSPAWIERSPMTLTFMALHRISELARYTPDVLAQHLDSQHNWLLSEFINLSLPQFLDEISAEMTGHEFMPPGVSPR